MTVDRSRKSANPNTPQSWNRYTYVTGDPVNTNDPSGLDPCSDDGFGTPEGCADDDSGNGPSLNPTAGTGEDGDAANYTDSDVSGTYCTDSAGNQTSCGAPGAVLTANGPDDGSAGSTNVVATAPGSSNGTLNSIASIFGYDQNIPLPSCFGIFFSSTVGNMAPWLPGLSNAAQEAFGVASAATYNQALKYAATASSSVYGTSFLRYPFKSSVFRGILAKSQNLAKAGPWAAVVIAELQGFIDEVQVMNQGGCQ